VSTEWFLTQNRKSLSQNKNATGWRAQNLPILLACRENKIWF